MKVQAASARINYHAYHDFVDEEPGPLYKIDLSFVRVVLHPAPYTLDDGDMTLMLRPEEVVSPRRVVEDEHRLAVVRDEQPPYSKWPELWTIIGGVRRQLGEKEFQYARRVYIEERHTQASYAKLWMNPDIVVKQVGAERGTPEYGRIMRSSSYRELCEPTRGE